MKFKKMLSLVLAVLLLLSGMLPATTPEVQATYVAVDIDESQIINLIKNASPSVGSGFFVPLATGNLDINYTFIISQEELAECGITDETIHILNSGTITLQIVYGDGSESWYSEDFHEFKAALDTCTCDDICSLPYMCYHELVPTAVYDSEDDTYTIEWPGIPVSSAVKLTDLYEYLEIEKNAWGDYEFRGRVSFCPPDDIPQEIVDQIRATRFDEFEYLGNTLKIVDFTLYSEETVQPPQLNSLENLIAKLFNGLTNALHKLIAMVLGRRVTIDDLVFNQYPDTKIDYFREPPGAGTDFSVLIFGNDGDGKGGLYETVNEWYGIFRMLAIVGYMVMLVYMGIRIMLASTGEKTAQYKTLFMYWVFGVIILFFYPYVMKYAIMLNETFVSIIADSREVIFGQFGLSVDDIRPDVLKPTTIPGDSIGDAVNLNIDDNPFQSGGTDYMSVIANQAIESQRLALALAYLIMTWQLITLTVHYYKRLMMTAFLITIFPLVTLSYAIDKIADGKSQSFNKWNKEFILNVFIQSFHAIVYVFVCGTVYSAGGLGDSYDFVLVIIGSTFLFTGEEIIKKIFSQESSSGATKSLAATAATTMVAATAAKKIVTGVAKPIVGKDSLYNKITNARAEVKAGESELRMFDKFAAPMQEPNVGLRLGSAQQAMQRIDANTSMTDEQKNAAKDRVTEVANARAALNNPNSRSTEELARAYETIKRAKQDPSYAHCADIVNETTKLSDAQMDDIEQTKAEVAGMIAGGVTDRQTIERHVKLKLAYTFEGMDENLQNKYTQMVFTDLAIYGATRGFTRSGTERELAQMETDARELGDSFRNLSSADFNDMNTLSRVGRLDADENLSEVLRARTAAFTDAGVYDPTLDETTRNLASAKAIYQNRGNNLFTAREQLNALERMNELGDESDETRAFMADVDEDLDVTMHILAKKMVASTDLTAEDRAYAQRILDRYEGDGVDTREGYTDEELSIHQVIALEGNDEGREEMLNGIHEARRETNRFEREAVQQMFTETLIDEGIDVEAGGLDTTTLYFNGKTREQIEAQIRTRKTRGIRRLVGMNSRDGEYSLEDLGQEFFMGGPEANRVEDMNAGYLNNLDEYYRHFNGDE